jgi:putative ATP-dependent endonuclease of the OLD family
MRIAQLRIKNFRGIAEANIRFGVHTVLIGDNNSGKSSVLEAIDLVLGPDRISRVAAIDEHDFYASRYLDGEGEPIPIEIEIIIVDLIPEQIRHFKAHLEFWDEVSEILIAGPPAGAIESGTVKEALRVCFRGRYDSDQDEFQADTEFCSPESEAGEQARFRTPDKRLCGFLFLRSLRTGSRALSLERGSLLDIILRVREIRPKLWEQVLDQLKKLPVAENSELGLSKTLAEIQSSLRGYVPLDWASDPQLRVSDMTREHLRKVLTVFMATGATTAGAAHFAPFQHQGTGTINTLVLALLSMIAEAKATVIFAMEEPETAIPPSIQKSIVGGVRSKASQALFTSHSPYVLEEFDPNEILVLARDSATGVLTSRPVVFPAIVKPKKYSSEFRLRFCEALLSRRVLIVEGATELLAYSSAGRRLAELDPGSFSTLEALGIALFSADSDTQIATFATFFREFGKTVFPAYDKQTTLAQRKEIEKASDHFFESPTRDFEDLLMKETAEAALRRFAMGLVDCGEWPTHLSHCKPNHKTSLAELKSGLKEYLAWGKARGSAGDLLAECSLTEMPSTITDFFRKVKEIVSPPSPSDPATANPAAGST